MSDLQTRVCDASERRDALQLIYAHLPAEERELHISRLLSESPGLVDGLLICKEGDRPIGAMLCLASAGRTLMVWPPAVASGVPFDTQLRAYARLMTTMRQYGAGLGVRLAQALLSEEELSMEPIFHGVGFVRLTQLIYMRRRLDEASVPPLGDAVEYVRYDDSLHAQLLNILDRSYAGSLDCPELNGARDLEDIFESHKAQGEFDPDRWFLVKHKGEWAGCLLLAGLPELAAIEVAYLSVLPRMRGHGLGRELTRKALHVALEAGADQVTLAVDERNAPARRMYVKEGFHPWESRHAYLLTLDPADGKFRR